MPPTPDSLRTLKSSKPQKSVQGSTTIHPKPLGPREPIISSLQKYENKEICFYIFNFRIFVNFQELKLNVFLDLGL